MCDKVHYCSEQSAIKQGRKKSGHCGGRVRAYRCLKCGDWHTTTKEKIKMELSGVNGVAHG